MNPIPATRRWAGLLLCAVLGLAIIVLPPSQPANAAYDDLPAFPGAEGFGYASTGGRGGEVYHVTSRELTGPGTFHDALTTTGETPRTIVFEVSGEIEIPQIVVRDASNITIAGQTAPGDGVTIKGNGVRFVNSSDIVIRYMRFRMGNQDFSDDSLYFEDSQNVIIDHSSFSWGTDEVLSILSKDYDDPQSKNITVQWSIMSEGLLTHSMGGLIEMNTISMHHNLYAHNNDRNPKTKGQIDFVNNVIYNWGEYPYVAGDSGTKGYGNVEGNYFIAGANSANPEYAVVRGNDNYNVYLEDNRIDSNKNGELDGVDTGEDVIEPERPAEVAPERFEYPPVHTQGPEDAYELVLDHAGASIARDGVDERVVDDVRDQTGVIIGDEMDVGGYPELQSGTAPVDTDRDGMPDDWEIAHGLDPHDPEDRNEDSNGNGYTNLEDYLNELAAPGFPAGYPLTPVEWTGTPFEPPVPEETEPEPRPAVNGELLRNVTVNDTSGNGEANAASWSVEEDLRPGDLVAGDRLTGDNAYRFDAIPDDLQGQEWIRSAVESRNASDDDLLSFYVPADTDIYVAHDSRISPRPPWLADEYEDTGEVIVDDQPATFNIFHRRATAGSHVVMGANSGGSVMNYFVVLKPVDEATAPPDGSAAGLEAEVDSNLSISLGWEPVDGAEGYLIYRSSMFDPHLRAIGSSASAAFTDDEAAAGVSFQYQVAAVNAGGESAVSNAADAEVYDPSEPVPATPQRLAVDESRSYSVDLTWNPVDSAVGYAVYRSTESGGGLERLGYASSPRFTDDSPSPSTRYTYQVAALAPGGESAESRPIRTTTHPPLQETVAPEHLTVAESPTSFSLDWSPVDDAEIYNVYRKADGDEDFELIGDSTVPEYVDVRPGGAVTGYTYRVSAENELGESVPSSEEYAATPVPPPPDDVFVGLSGKDFVGLIWTSHGEATEFLVYRTSDGEPAQVVGEAKVNTFYDRTADPDTEYTYFVTASNAAGESEPSDSVEARTDPEPEVGDGT